MTSLLRNYLSQVASTFQSNLVTGADFRSRDFLCFNNQHG